MSLYWCKDKKKNFPPYVTPTSIYFPCTCTKIYWSMAILLVFTNERESGFWLCRYHNPHSSFFVCWNVRCPTRQPRHIHPTFSHRMVGWPLSSLLCTIWFIQLYWTYHCINLKLRVTQFPQWTHRVIKQTDVVSNFDSWGQTVTRLTPSWKPTENDYKSLLTSI